MAILRKGARSISFLVESGLQVDKTRHRPDTVLGAYGTHKNIVHKQNYSEHFGKEYDFKCAVRRVVYICGAKDSASFPVSSWINFNTGPGPSTETVNCIYMLVERLLFESPMF